MDFGFTAEQEMLRDAARKFLATAFPPAVARAAMASPTAHDPARWQRLAGLGWLGILVPEELGGQGGSFLDMAVVLEEIGKALVPGPFFASAVLGTVAVREAGSPQQKQRILPALARGEHVLTVAPGAADDAPTALTSDDGAPPALSADGDRVRGRARFVLDAHVADALVIAARAPGADDRRLVLVERGAVDIEVTPLQTVDMTRRLCTVELRNVPCTPLGDAAVAATALRRVLDHACAGLALELVGVGQRALEMAVAYANERTQFGRPIGSFQAIKHKCVDMMVAVETARSLAYYAAWAVSEDASDAGRAAAMAKAYCGEMAKTVTSEAIQVHGGIGFTWEHDLHLYYRRALAADAAFGAAPAHRETIVRALVG
ncbi:MAG: acyl-CoA/acyl-ACP dehydrogenase [Deltaproteobacteria bacterium]|nr:acyl-CoA/acyl-ACP dehydrogenase [Deltaproteobacteria bacterium]